MAAFPGSSPGIPGGRPLRVQASPVSLQHEAIDQAHPLLTITPLCGPRLIAQQAYFSPHAARAIKA